MHLESKLKIENKQSKQKNDSMKYKYLYLIKMNKDIIIAGLAKVGKSSIKKIVFEKITPPETKYLDTSERIESFVLDNMVYTSATIRDFPSNYNYDKISPDDTKLIQSAGILIYVINCQAVNESTFDHMKKVVNCIVQKNPKIMVDIFFHKLDGDYFFQGSLSNQKTSENISQINKNLNDLHLHAPASIFKTSIYDYSLFEAFSSIFQKTLPLNKLFCKLLDSLSHCCNFEKSYLFDVSNKIYLATDHSPIHEKFFETCSDMIDVVSDLTAIYGEDTGLMDSEGVFSFDENFYSLIKLEKTNEEDRKYFLYMKFLDKSMAVICIISEKNLDRLHMIDFNIKNLKDGIAKIYETYGSNMKEI
jgi:Ras-related GTP-binding protein C/D